MPAAQMPAAQVPVVHALPVYGTAAGAGYVALPPTAVDAVATGATRLIIAWPGFDPPRTAGALAAAIPMTGVPAWRVFLDLPGRSPGGLGSGAILESEAVEAYGAAVIRAVESLPATVAELRRDLAIPDGPIGLAGFSAGAAAALLAVARGTVPVSTAALVAPVVAPSRAARAVEKRAGRDRTWTEPARALADRLDLGSLAGDIAARDVALLFVAGAKDRVVPPSEITALCDALRRSAASLTAAAPADGPPADASPNASGEASGEASGTGCAVESVTLRMGHALVPEPGTEPRPPITEAVRADGVLTEWFRERLAEVRHLPVAEAPAVRVSLAERVKAAAASGAGSDR
ncbi:hypothetical protein [Actinomadura fibrosa]|nr:hypothetical protein [Actinomadura fibrosa]